MLFNSFSFLLFFPIVTAAYFMLPARFRWMMLLIASSIFYMFFVPEYILILAATIVIDYFAGILIERENEQKRKRKWLIASIVANISVLFVFKYFNFFALNFNELASDIGWNYGIPSLKIILPIGLSFHTFQAMSYTIEVYRGKQKAERHFGIYSLYVMYYPQLVAGPIERPQNLLWQFHAAHRFDYQRVTDGLKLMAWGLFKKVIIADRISSLINPVYENPAAYDGISLLVAAILFSFQIFCDFSGYSDIAIGSSQVMGIRLMKNFDRPYFSKSIAEFWKRWHISLSSWFKDYLYISIGGNRKGIFRTFLNIFITFLISGLWHGASWPFVIWGGLHGFYMIVGLLTVKLRLRIRNLLRISKHIVLNNILQAGTTFMLVTFAWIFFRAETTDKAFYMISKMVADTGHFLKAVISHQDLSSHKVLLLDSANNMHFNLGVILCAIVLMEIVHYQQRTKQIRSWIMGKPLPLRWFSYLLLFWLIVLFGVYHSKNEFIYFQF